MTRPAAPMQVRRKATQWESTCRCCPLTAVGSHAFVLRAAVKHVNASTTTSQGDAR